jgi:flagellar biosynthesis protein FliP
MKKRLLALSRLYGSSSSEEEFWLKATVEGTSFPVELLFRLYLFRRRHPDIVMLMEHFVLVGGVVAFSALAGIAGPKSALLGVGALLLSLFVMAPITLLAMEFDRLYALMSEIEKASK